MALDEFRPSNNRHRLASTHLLFPSSLWIPSCALLTNSSIRDACPSRFRPPWRHILRRPYAGSAFRKLVQALLAIAELDFNAIQEASRWLHTNFARGPNVWIHDLPLRSLAKGQLADFGNYLLLSVRHTALCQRSSACHTTPLPPDSAAPSISHGFTDFQSSFKTATWSMSLKVRSKVQCWVVY
jgi:hypothetical protein